MLSFESDHIAQVSCELFAAVIVAKNSAKISVYWLQGFYMLSLESDHVVQFYWELFAAVIVA